MSEVNGKKIHELKILPEYFDAVRCGDKRFEIRKNDRNFHRGDILRLKEWNGKEYTGEEIDALVRYVLYDWTGGLQDGYCIMSIDTMMHNIPRQKEFVHPEPSCELKYVTDCCCDLCGVQLIREDCFCRGCGRPIVWER